jgi:phage shock protein E
MARSHTTRDVARFALLATALAAGCALVYRQGDVRGKDARALVERGALLVDVRTPEEFAAGHLPGAINVPVDEIDRRASELGDPHRSVVLYCRSGRRSARAAELLGKRGFTAVRNLGPMSAW